MELTALEQIDRQELELRYQRCRAMLAAHLEQAVGLMVLNPVSIYYFTGTLGAGLLWLPREGEPVLMVRHGLERAKLESPLEAIYPFKSFSQVPGIAASAGSPLPEKPGVIGVDAAGTSWSIGNLITSRLANYSFVPADRIIDMTRSVKTDWELKKLRLAGERHHHALYNILPQRIAAGMSERDIAHKSWEVFFELGHSGLMRMSGSNEDIFLGHVAAGDSANYPSRYNGPVGLRGEHPSVPFMGYAGRLWNTDEPLTCDIGFCLEGYQTDKTQVYWTGCAIPDQVRDGHNFCIQVQEWLRSQLKPGSIPSELYAHCIRWAEKEGFAEGFMALDENKVPFLGHGIGLNIDEYPVIAKGFDAPLEAGMVMALEPKLGIRDLGMVGVENTFEVTESGGVSISGEEFGIVRID